MKKIEAKRVITTQRKLLFNGTSYYLCLPKRWVKKVGLEKGDYVPIVGDGILKIVPVQEIR